MIFTVFAAAVIGAIILVALLVTRLATGEAQDGQVFR